MGIHQILPSITIGDAVSNECLKLQDLFKNMGYESRIFAENIDPRLASRVEAYTKCPDSSDELLIFHYSIGSEVTAFVHKLKVRKILWYHNITPYDYFTGYNNQTAYLCKKGRDELKSLAGDTVLCIADSEYNGQELREAGFEKIVIIPILLDFKEYDQLSLNPDILTKYGDRKNLLFVGKIAPHKAQKDLVKYFYYFNRYVTKDYRLILVGSYDGFEKYHTELKYMIDTLGLTNVVITGKIPFKDLVSYYKVASVFLCASDHEGFCVPLVEAMYFGIPIVAYAGTAIPGTLNGAGLVFADKDDVSMVTELIDIILKEQKIKDWIVRKERAQIEAFLPEKVEEKLWNVLDTIGFTPKNKP